MSKGADKYCINCETLGISTIATIIFKDALGSNIPLCEDCFEEFTEDQNFHDFFNEEETGEYFEE